MQQVKAGLKAIYLSGWQVAADANTAGADVSGPVALSGRFRAELVPPHQRGLRRADQIEQPKASVAPTGSRRSSPTPRPASAAR